MGACWKIVLVDWVEFSVFWGLYWSVEIGFYPHTTLQHWLLLCGSSQTPSKESIEWLIIPMLTCLLLSSFHTHTVAHLFLIFWVYVLDSVAEFKLSQPNSSDLFFNPLKGNFKFIKLSFSRCKIWSKPFWSLLDTIHLFARKMPNWPFILSLDAKNWTI